MRLRLRATNLSRRLPLRGLQHVVALTGKLPVHSFRFFGEESRVSVANSEVHFCTETLSSKTALTGGRKLEPSNVIYIAQLRSTLNCKLLAEGGGNFMGGVLYC